MHVAPVFFTAITKTDDFWPEIAGASETFTLALAQAAWLTGGAAGAVVLPPAAAGLEAATGPEDEAPPVAEEATVLGAPDAAEELVAAAPAAAGLAALDAQPVAATATRAPPARSAMLFSRFMPG
ncbi:hypothetical protein [Catenulispora sp. GAS73]|uniref:hypothetical protein n=1 Tax=Catenulispora sp. GAS73 TaxID=3156269 RepID=UPI0035164790